MKLKNFIKKRSVVKETALESAKRISPVYSKYFVRFRKAVQCNPKRTLLILLFAATANFVVLLIVVNHRPKPTISLAYQKTKMVLFTSDPGVNFSVSNYFTLKDLKDSLELIMHKQKMTSDDTLLFIRIYRQYAKIDPVFFSQLNKYSNEKNGNRP
jgi:hypothetical protein